MSGVLGYIGFSELDLLIKESVNSFRCKDGDRAGFSILSFKPEFESELKGKCLIGKKSEMKSSLIVQTEYFAIAYKGIIENFFWLKEGLLKSNVSIELGNDTDIEVLAHLIKYYQDEGYDISTSLKMIMGEAIGVFSFILVAKNDPGILYTVEKGCELSYANAGGGYLISNDEMHLPAEYQNTLPQDSLGIFRPLEKPQIIKVKYSSTSKVK